MDAIECMKTRRSVRVYQDKPIPREIIEDIVDCGRLAATAINIQPWQFIVVQDPGMRKKIADTTDYGKFIAQAPVCIAVFCQDTKYYLEDGSAATQNILNAARAHELGSCWVAGDKKAYAPKIGEMLGMPPNYKLVSLVSIGYPIETPNPGKKPLSEVLHWERYSG
ncbi:MAG: nitroreductase family protein [Armatimonadota bacterium]|nr:nitroreductase family protein [Armatimonadota bacterium]